MSKYRNTWFEDVYNVLYGRGGKAHLSKIYDDVWKRRRAAGRSLPKNWMSIVRTTLEDRCSGAYFRTGHDIFYMPEGKGAGIWGIRVWPVEIDLWAPESVGSGKTEATDPITEAKVRATVAYLRETPAGKEWIAKKRAEIIASRMLTVSS
jgi:hypothetical protein